MEWQRLNLIILEDICNRITGAMMWVSTYGVFILLAIGVVLNIIG
jgi:hypothetical protein